MGLSTIYNTMLIDIESNLKSITELSDVIETPVRSKVHFYKGKPAFKEGEYEVTIIPGIMTPIEGVTSHSTWNEFLIFIDLLHYRNSTDTIRQAYLNGLTVAEKVYDKFHLSNIITLVKVCRVTIMPGEGVLSQRNIDAIPFRVQLACELAVTQI